MTNLQFGVFIPQGWKMELSSIPDPVDKFAENVIPQVRAANA